MKVNVFSTKSSNWEHYILRFLLETGPPPYVVIRATRRSSRAKTVALFLNWPPAPMGQTPDLSLTAAKRFTN